jgi:hypothetical protein
MIQTFIEAILEAKAAAVPIVRPNRFCLALSPQIKSMTAPKNGWWRVWQNSCIHRKLLIIFFETSVEVLATKCVH